MLGNGGFIPQSETRTHSEEKGTSRKAVLDEALRIAAEMVVDEVNKATKAARAENAQLLERVSELEGRIAQMEADKISREQYIMDMQRREIDLGTEFESQISGLQELLTERDQQIRSLGLMLQRELKATDVESGSLPRVKDLQERSKIEVSDIRSNSWKLVTSKRTLHAQAPSADDLARWMSAIGAAIKIERELAEGAFGSDSESDNGGGLSSPVYQTQLVGDYSAIVRDSVRLSSSKLSSFCLDKIDDCDSKTRKTHVLTPRDQRESSRDLMMTTTNRPMWEPMVGLFNQLMNHLGTPSPRKSTRYNDRNKEKNANNSDSDTKSAECDSQAPCGWRLKDPLSDALIVPPLVRHCCNFLRSKNRLDTVGIFRVPGQRTVVDTIYSKLADCATEVGNDDTFAELATKCSSLSFETNADSDIDRRVVHNVAALMKRSLTELPEAV
eukprot:g3181.t1